MSALSTDHIMDTHKWNMIIEPGFVLGLFLYLIRPVVLLKAFNKTVVHKEWFLRCHSRS